MEEVKQPQDQEERKNEENSDSDYSLVTTSSEDKDSVQEDDIQGRKFPTNEDILTYLSSFSDSKLKPKFYDDEIEYSDDEKHKLIAFKDDGHISDPNWKKITGEIVKKMSYRKPTVKEIKMRLAIFLQDHKSTQTAGQNKTQSKN